jgi:hypothetical protein
MIVALALGGALAAAGPAAAAPAQPDLTPHVAPSLLHVSHMRHPEVLTHHVSGFWTSNRPAIGGAYRYRMLLIGVAIAALSAILTIRLIRRSRRAGGDGGAASSSDAAGPSASGSSTARS